MMSMRPDQRPLGSGFGAHTTAAQVLTGIDLIGRRALVTGGYSGLGLEIVRALTGAGATVLVPARRPAEGAAALAGLSGVDVGHLDLADQGSVATYADSVLADGRPLDIIIANAGVMACPEERVGPGWELQLATNHLGHFALVNRIWPLVGDGARIVSVSSSGHHRSGMRWDDPWFDSGYDKWLAYGQSKTANVLFALHLDRVAGRGVHAFSLHPGAILTPLGRHLTESDIGDLVALDETGKPLLPDFKSPEAGAATAVWAATSGLLAEHGGAYLEDCDIAPLAAVDGVAEVGVKPYAVDPDEAARLWAWSAHLTGVDAFG